MIKPISESDRLSMEISNISESEKNSLRNNNLKVNSDSINMNESGKRKFGGFRRKEVNLKKIAEENVVAATLKLTRFLAKKKTDVFTQDSQEEEISYQIAAIIWIRLMMPYVIKKQ